MSTSTKEEAAVQDDIVVIEQAVQILFAVAHDMNEGDPAVCEPRRPVVSGSLAVCARDPLSLLITAGCTRDH